MTGAIKLQPDDGPRSSIGIGSSSDDAVGSHRRSLGDSLKGSGSSLGTCQEIAGRRPKDSPQEYWRLSNWWERVTHPGWAVEPLVPRNLGTLGN
ncbi:hypothetical protein BHE74_00047971 [Ensete ventricosum]|nr:hypothetical protein GW17_00022602 [Ensete ventricosum]RWW46121.1 hypothetical protein BHE74_00047971 [Ensete ventricosum]RZS27390.1 hypothetical protein BHM03_00060807 [Ensete ventricosum]